MKLLFDNQKMAEEFFDNTRMIGIMSSVKDYQICWHLNQLLDMNLILNNEIEIQLTKKNRNYFFGVYEYNEPAGSLSHYIYNNQFDGEYLLHEFKHLDFLWLMKGDFVDDNSLQLKIDALRSISGIQLVVELTHEKIRNKEYMVF